MDDRASELSDLRARLRENVVFQRGEPIVMQVDGQTITGTTGDITSARNPDGPAAADAIESLLADLERMQEGLEGAASTFETYAGLHWGKGTPEGDAKGNANARMAEWCRSALQPRKAKP